MTIEVLTLKQVSRDEWNKDIINPTQLYEFAFTRPNAVPIFIKSGEFKWLMFVRGFRYFCVLNIVSEPNIQSEEKVVEVLNYVVAKFKPVYLNFYSITLSRFRKDTIFYDLGFQNIYKYASSQLDLTQDEDILFKNIHSKHRNVIRKALREGVEIFEDNTIEGLRNFRDMSVITYRRSNKPPLKFSYLKNHFEALKPFNRIRIFFAKYKNTLQASAIFLTSDSMSIYWHGASINKPITGAANLLHWEVIKKFKSEGIKLYDFGGISLDTNDPKAVGINRFKERFGGNIEIYYGGKKLIGYKRYRMLKFLRSLLKI